MATDEPGDAVRLAEPGVPDPARRPGPLGRARRAVGRHRLASAAALVVVAAVAALAVLLPIGSANDPATAAPAVHLGPQGSVPQFVVRCGFSHAATDDPIVHPGHTGMSHRHDFFGNQTTDASSTAASLLGRPTTCNRRLDTAAYWAPSLYDHDVPVTPLGSLAYYRPAPGVDAAALTPYPTGLMMVSGDSTSTTAQPITTAAWACGSSSDLESTPPTCPPAAPLRVRITFPDCWDGTNLDSADHRAHVARSAGGVCPESHPVVLPQLTLVVRYPISGEGHDLRLASGSTLSAHADFLNAWDERELTDQVTLCLHRKLVCSVASNRAEDEAEAIPSAAAPA